MKLDRVFIDTNVLISGLLYRHGNEAELLEAACRGELTIVLSAYVISEARDVFAAKFPHAAHVFEEFLAGAPYEVAPDPGSAEISVARGIVRDPNDVGVLAAMLSSKPDVALTGDKDLLTDEIRAIAPVWRCAEYLDRRSGTDN